MSRTEILFLYGSLQARTGHDQVDRIIARFTRVMYQGYVHGQLYDLGRYPGLLASDDSQQRVFGRVVSLSRAAFNLPLLDKFEDYRDKDQQGSEYLRRRVQVFCPHNRQLEAWCYLYNRPVQPESLIRSGSWLAHSEQLKHRQSR